jgi:hypothetical protein
VPARKNFPYRQGWPSFCRAHIGLIVGVVPPNLSEGGEQANVGLTELRQMSISDDRIILLAVISTNHNATSGLDAIPCGPLAEVGTGNWPGDGVDRMELEASAMEVISVSICS